MATGVKLKKFFCCPRGGVAVTFGLTGPALAMLAGLAIDYAMMTGHRANLQSMADAAAVAAAREIPIANLNPAIIESVADTFVKTNSEGLTGLSAKTTVVGKFSGVVVDLQLKWTPFFAHLFSNKVTPINVTAEAVIASSANICVLGLNEIDSKAIHLDHDAVLTGKNCAVYANSTKSDGIRVDANGLISASLICSAGGTSGGNKAYAPSPTTDCPKMDDPMASRPEPGSAGCNFNNTEIKDEVRTLSPGVYCNGIKIAGNADVTFSPGIYVIKDKKLEVQDEAKVSGSGVGFYLADDNVIFEFTENTSIDLTAPVDGAMAGILFFESRSVSQGRKHRISSNNAHTLLGTFYLPRGILLVDSKSPVAGNSAFTIIVASDIHLLEQPNLILNANYSDTDVPAPAGLTGGRVALVK